MTPPGGYTVAVIGGGPAGLAAAEVLAGGGALVHLYDAKPTVARKFLMAGRGGLNITHSEPFDQFAGRYGARRAQMQPALAQFDPGRCANGFTGWASKRSWEAPVGCSRAK